MTWVQHSKWGLGAWVQTLGIRHQGDDQSSLLRRYSEVSSTRHSWGEPREKPGPAKRQEHFCGNLLSRYCPQARACMVTMNQRQSPLSLRLKSKVSMRSIGRGQEATTVQTCGVTATTKLQAGMSCFHVLHREPQQLALCWGSQQDQPEHRPQTVETYHRSWPQQTHPHTPTLFVPLSWLSWTSTVNQYFHSLMSGWRTDIGKWPTSRGVAKIK